MERTTVHISDDTGRIAMRELRNLDYDDDGSKAMLTRYIYSNHLQSSSLELDEEAKVISYEEYHPYGTTAYQASSSTINTVAKRYRYTGKERDDESGLYYHGARYYIPWLCRWCSCDPLESKYAGLSSYNYSFNNPVVWNDPSGMEGEETIYVGGYKGDDIVVQGQRMQEGASKIVDDPGMYYGPGITNTPATRDALYFHLGSEGHSRGWYSEESYTSMNKEVITGLLHGIVGEGAPGAFNPMWYGGTEALAKADTAAGEFLQKNGENLSPDFSTLIKNKAGDIISSFNYQYGGYQRGNIDLSPIDPIAELGPAIITGLIRNAAKGALAIGEREVSIATSKGSILRSASQGGEFLDDGLRMIDQPLAPKEILKFDIRSIQHMFNRHSKDFGVTGNWNKNMAKEFEGVLRDHMNELTPIRGTYRGTQPALHYYNPKTGLNVMTDLDANLMGGWKLSADQIKYLLTTGNVK